MELQPIEWFAVYELLIKCLFYVSIFIGFDSKSMETIDLIEYSSNRMRTWAAEELHYRITDRPAE